MRPASSPGAAARAAPPRSVPLKAVLLCGIFGITAILVAALGVLGMQSWRTYAEVRRLGVVEAAGKSLMATAFDLLRERAQTNSALRDGDPAPTGVLNRIAVSRRLAEEGLKSALPLILTADFPNRDALADEFRNSDVAAKVMRDRVDRILLLPKSERDQVVLTTYMPVMIGLVDSALKAWFAALYATSQGDPTIDHYAGITRLGWLIRELSGFERAVVLEAISSNERISDRGIRELERYRNQIALAWKLVETIADDPSIAASVKAEVARASGLYFGDFEPRVDAMLKLSREGAPYRISGAAFLTATNPQIDPQFDLIRTTASASEDLTGRVLVRAVRNLVAVIVGILAAVGTTAGCFVMVIRRLTERQRADDELRQAQALLQTVIDNVPTSIMVRDAVDFRHVLFNRASEELSGLSREDVIGRTAADIFPVATAEFITWRDHDPAAAGGQLVLEQHEIQTPHKGSRLINSRRLTILGENGMPQLLVSVLEDTTERNHAEARIAHLASHDPLTDLPNRAGLNEHLGITIEHAKSDDKSFAVMSIDLDRFKEVNDSFGHAVGDALLCDQARRLKDAADGAFVARLGGDEFMLIVADGATPSSVEAIAHRVLNSVAGEVVIKGYALRIGYSIGVAMFPSDGSDLSTLLARADAALSRAKAEGRGAIRFFEPGMDNRLRERRALQHDLATAIEHGEISLHYQPQALIDREIIGFEALLRWSHRTRGPVSPDTFIPVAEESGLIIPIGEWVLREACREAASWPRPLRIAVNLSPVQFRDGDLPALIHSILLETGLAADRLEVEITEGVLIADFARTLSILRRLKLLGIRIAMDDFGTGYSSLSYLQAFPFDKIKIDRGFIASLSSNTQSAAIVRAVIGLARGLDLPVVAEGVETEEQLAFLSGESCTEVQGYLLGRPKPISDYEDLVGRSGIRRIEALLAG